jgi:pimeloyl-ACP methyl ester carboxylesterase
VQELPPEAAEKARKFYDYGHTAIFASSVDPRFHYLLYVPHYVADGRRVKLIVAIHGTGRTSAIEFRDHFAEFAQYHNCAVFCPIFPVNVAGDGGRSGYKYILGDDIRYDELLLSMVEEVAEKYNQNWNRFAMFGFSGGGQFTHRFAILHPDRLWAASIGAPGCVTLLDPERDWWVGTRNVAGLFGMELNLDALKELPVQMVVGSLDLETWEIVRSPGTRYWVEGANDAGATRIDRLTSLSRSFKAAGVNVTFDKVPGVAHDRLKVLNHVKHFFEIILCKENKCGK